MKDFMLQAIDVAAILEELFNFNGQIEELCYAYEAEGKFGIPADQMIAILREFIETVKSLGWVY